MRRYFPVNKVTWQDVKGTQVICGAYEEAVKMMGDLNFLSALMNFPKEQITDETVELLKPYFAAPDFNYEAAKKVCSQILFPESILFNPSPRLNRKSSFLRPLPAGPYCLCLVSVVSDS